MTSIQYIRYEFNLTEMINRIRINNIHLFSYYLM